MGLRVSKIVIHNVLGVEEFEVSPGRFTRIAGPNASGKTSILEAIKSIWTGNTHDASLLRRGAKKGEICLLLNDGVEIIKEIFADKSVLSVKVPKLGKISRAPSYVKDLVSSASLNPVEFLTAKPERQKELFLRAMPLHITREQLEAAVGFPLTIPTDGHAFDVLAAAEKMFYDDRTEVNRTLKQKQAAVQQLATSLPKAPPEGDWPAQVKQCQRQVKALEEESWGRKQQAERQASEEMIVLNRNMEAQIAELRRGTQEQMHELERTLADGIQSIRQVAGEMAGEKQDALKVTLNAIEEQVAPQHQEWIQKAEHARTMADQYIASESARTLLAQYEADGKALAEEAQGLTQGLLGLRTLRASLTANLPIPGVTVGEQELEVDGIPMSRVEASRKVTLAVELAMLGAGELPLIIVDGIEALDHHTLDLFKATISKYEAQVLAARVEDPDPTRPETLTLTVEREG